MSQLDKRRPCPERARITSTALPVECPYSGHSTGNGLRLTIKTGCFIVRICAAAGRPFEVGRRPDRQVVMGVSPWASAWRRGRPVRWVMAHVGRRTTHEPRRGTALLATSRIVCAKSAASRREGGHGLLLAASSAGRPLWTAPVTVSMRAAGQHMDSDDGARQPSAALACHTRATHPAPMPHHRETP